MEPLVIYHGACRDGFCAAWAVRRHFAAAAAVSLDFAVTPDFHAGNYGQPPPDTTDRDVIMVDFSYPAETMQEIAEKCSSLLVLDHHKTAEAALSGFSHPRAQVVFDMNRSGAGLAWDHFMPAPRHWIVDYIEDRDLWRFKLPHSEEVNAYLSVIPFDFEAWSSAAEMSAADVVYAGQVVHRKTQNYVAEVAKNARRVTFEGYDVPIVNAPQVDISELVGFLCNGETFAMGWWQRSDGMFSYSLRSRGNFDVSALATKHGGGGHKNAAGFLSPTMIL